MKPSPFIYVLQIVIWIVSPTITLQNGDLYSVHDETTSHYSPSSFDAPNRHPIVEINELEFRSLAALHLNLSIDTEETHPHAYTDSCCDAGGVLCDSGLELIALSMNLNTNRNYVDWDTTSCVSAIPSSLVHPPKPVSLLIHS